ncbi:hypothetical protein ACFO9E_06715 [Streptomyces maoxianensis]|uniref:Fe/B12 periplasmic-binding domain-containing protein n=1 Tax=Streptomyces maoxianensis TaxID=1459942 RepID=A0ABV9G3K0_9ACTN
MSDAPDLAVDALLQGAHRRPGFRQAARRGVPRVVVERNLVIGQNPASSAPVAAEILKVLG